MTRPGVGVPLVALVLLAVLPGVPLGVPLGAPLGVALAAQDLPSEVETVRLLRQAAALEAGGRHAEAREVLERVLREEPGSVGALLALERVLRPLDAIAEVLPWADRLLELDPGATGVRHLKLRVLAETDSLPGLQSGIEAWIAASPRSAEPYREGARLLRNAGAGGPALELLRRGSRELPDPAPLLSGLGEVLLEQGDTAAAAETWADAVGADGAGTGDVLRHLADLDPAARSAVARPLVVHLRETPGGAGALQAGVRIALAAGLEDEAIQAAEAFLETRTGRARRGYLAELAGAASGLPEVELWALQRLREVASDGAEGVALDRRLAELALQTGDTAAALDARRRVVEELPPGSAERRDASSELIRAEALGRDGDVVVARLEAFRREFPDAPEGDALSAQVAATLRARGEDQAAVRALEGAEGPRSSLERAYLLLEAGDVEAAREGLSAALPGLRAERATRVLQLVTLLDRLGPVGADLVGRSAAAAQRGRVREAVGVVAEGVGALPEEERPAVLAHGARLADGAGLAAEAADLRARLLEGYPDAPERGEATLALARYRAETPEGVPEAVELLETLIVERPDSPAAPGARRLLDALRRGTTGAVDGGVSS